MNKNETNLLKIKFSEIHGSHEYCKPYTKLAEKIDRSMVSPDVFSYEVKKASLNSMHIVVVADKEGGGFICVTPVKLSILKSLNNSHKYGDQEIIAVDITGANSDEIKSIILFDVFCTSIIYLLGNMPFKIIGSMFRSVSRKDKKHIFSTPVTQVNFSEWLKVKVDKIFSSVRNNNYSLSKNDGSGKYTKDNVIAKRRES